MHLLIEVLGLEDGPDALLGLVALGVLWPLDADGRFAGEVLLLELSLRFEKDQLYSLRFENN